ncbi:MULTISPECIES: Fpg/Nei family DNA glycosylase [Nocardiaceae]|uniref:DNA-(apurinic or apyrimidinic site) lyase n=1 Tax=Rhodococcoides kroppenstedtii TaxID=293050 RepID=A0ABS7NQR4_9NOCA|nr:MULTISPECIES: DNA-formamidopyrimidine glycosylase family protein [Rhodococcus]AMY18374.1 Endonuclease 8 1 [Rhodococcus sp. PBTS 1]MBY6312334.1 Fpg/Nei family DNA glycosylase [Rhodococcus kroppenstedtii]MBY6320354.1 Fpg/Nei family DNA glycosylase [Rhodococcus kroppenstedtii]MBY6398625.1 Fpg/Nei family DNA glycosylase [Rhodococcus kroppenstedtii]
MPEGHTLHRLARAHQKSFAGQELEVSSPQGRFVEGAEWVTGHVLLRADAWGKHLLHRYDNGAIVHVHLGLYGKFTDQPVPMKDPVGQVRMRLVGRDKGTDLRGPTRCEIFDESDVDALVARLGPDPLRRESDPDKAFHRIHKSSVAIGALLMEQDVVAGIGNVYRAELLFRHGVDPFLPGRKLDVERWSEMWVDLVDLMKLGVRRGRIVTLRPEHDSAASRGPGRPRSYVYKRTGLPCRICGTPIRTQDMKGRNLFWCPTCQAD